MTAVTSIEQTFRDRYAAARKALWPVRARKPIEITAPREAAMSSARSRREAELRQLKYRIDEKKVLEQRRLRREVDAAKRQVAAMEKKADRARRVEERAREAEEERRQPKWEDIGPNLVHGTLEEIAAQVLSYFPRYTFDTVKKVDRVKKRANVLRLICVAIKVLHPDLPVTQIAKFVGRDHSTVTCLLMRSHLAEMVIRRPSFAKSKLSPHHASVRDMWLSGVNQRDIAASFSVDQSAVCRLIRKQGWKR